MLLSRLLSPVVNKNINKCRPLLRFYATQQNRSHSSKVVEEEDPPVKFSQSPARSWQARASRTGLKEARLWYEPYVIIASLSVFLIYFTVLREENDIDEELGKSLYSRIEGLEEHQLQLSLKYNESQGLETEQIKARLRELQEEKVRKYNN